MRTSSPPLPGASLGADRMPGHWLLARLGKRVLRPGGVELTRRLLDALDIGTESDVVELAPGLGSTTEMVMARRPASYIGVDRDADAASRVRTVAQGPSVEVVRGSAGDTGLGTDSADVVFGEAYLTMQPASQKQKIVAELARVVRPGGRVGLHEVAYAPDDISDEDAAAVSESLTSTIKVNVTPLSTAGWVALLESAGFQVDQQFSAPLHLLEPRRLVADEGLAGAARFVRNVLRDRDARARVLSMRRSMRRHADHLQAIALTATRVAA